MARPSSLSTTPYYCCRFGVTRTTQQRTDGIFIFSMNTSVQLPCDALTHFARKIAVGGSSISPLDPRTKASASLSGVQAEAADDPYSHSCTAVPPAMRMQAHPITRSFLSFGLKRNKTPTSCKRSFGTRAVFKYRLPDHLDQRVTTGSIIPRSIPIASTQASPELTVHLQVVPGANCGPLG